MGEHSHGIDSIDGSWGRVRKIVWGGGGQGIVCRNSLSHAYVFALQSMCPMLLESITI
jgi:hypothetical protein